VPFPGVIPGLIIVTAIAWLPPHGGLQLVGQVFVVFAAVQLIESWLLTPKSWLKHPHYILPSS
jgi:predicted PurR-regulated permease PerM